MADNSEGRKRRRVRGDGAGGGFGGQPASSAPKRRKRFLWTDDLHRMFVAAIFDHGLKVRCAQRLQRVAAGAVHTAGVSLRRCRLALQSSCLSSWETRRPA